MMDSKGYLVALMAGYIGCAALAVSCSGGGGGDAGPGPPPSGNNVVFVTSVQGNGDLSSWPDAQGQHGLAAADAICQSRATAAGLTGTYRAWLSDDTDDAYCRIQGVSGKKSTDCGGNDPAAKAGPWVRTDGYRFAATIDQMVLGAVYTPARYDEFGNPKAAGTFYFTATLPDGTLFSTPCSNWTSTTGDALNGSADRTGSYWSWSSRPGCDTELPLLCFQTGAGPALPALPAAANRVFLSSAIGNGKLDSWADAGGQSGIAAGDAICQARAVASNLTGTYRAWLSDASVDAVSRITPGPRVRLDGVKVADSIADLTDGTFFAPINLTETGVYVGQGSVWTGSDSAGLRSTATCSGWTDGTNAVSGRRTIASDASPLGFAHIDTCDRWDMHLYCFEE